MSVLHHSRYAGDQFLSSVIRLNTCSNINNSGGSIGYKIIPERIKFFNENGFFLYNIIIIIFIISGKMSTRISPLFIQEENTCNSLLHKM